MSYSRAALPTEEHQAMANDGVQLYSRNLLPELPAGNVIWTTSAGAVFNLANDITDPDYPIVHAFDGFANLPTRAVQGTTASAFSIVVYLQDIAGVTQEFDSIIIRLGTTNLDLDTILVEIADDANFTTNRVPIASWGTSGVILFDHQGANAPAHGRALARYVGDTATSNKDVFTVGSGGAYVRITFNNLSGATGFGPAVHEIFLGKRRTISRPMNFPWDDQPRGTDKAVMQAKGRVRQRYVRARGFADHRLSFTPTGDDAFGKDDVATLRQVYDDTLGFSDPLWLIHGRERAVPYFMEVENDELRMNLVGYVERAADLSLTELSVFANADGEFSTLANLPPQAIP